MNNKGKTNNINATLDDGAIYVTILEYGWHKNVLGIAF